MIKHGIAQLLYDSSFIMFIGYVKQEFFNRPQTQESCITRIDASSASIR